MSNPTDFSDDKLNIIIDHLDRKHTPDSIRDGAKNELYKRGYSKDYIDHLENNANKYN